MKTRFIFLYLILSLLSINATHAQSWVKKASKSVITLKTFDAQGVLLATASGVFVGEQGEAISSFTPFKGAHTAVVIDADGKDYPVEQILGANDTYDVAKFQVSIKKSQPLQVSAQSAAQGTAVWILPFRENKRAIEGVVSKTETFNGDNAYYSVRIKAPQDGVGVPLFNAQGQLLALMQPSSSTADSLSYAVSALFADSLRMSGLSINDAALRSTDIKKALPSSLEQAQVTLFMAGSTLDSTAYAQLLDDFITQFPSAPDGYLSRAQFVAGADRYEDADNDFDLALKTDSRTDETHFNYSRLIYQKLLYKPDPPYEPWTFDKALQEAELAYQANPQPSYRQQQAYVLYAMKRYADASAIYETLYDSPLRSPDLFVEASHCKMMQADTVAFLALLDSAVALFSRPYLKEAAPYILTRAQARLGNQKYREATSDLNDYEQLMATQVNDRFYYLRFQAEQGGRLFQQALNDINKAIQIAPEQSLYYAEKASLQVRVGLYDEAMETAQECIKLDPEYSDGHLFLGLAKCLKGQKEEGVKSLLKAKELGDSQADGLIEKYGK